ncbi:MAG: 30S ribosomal protein S4 [Alphaproteobacteria bacterium MarineAlpha5_Bin8]|nr:MAG: 30S ribosomal protein S4 [Alphaproteobacteria bacterium MarineAlpha5_Bin8]PPR45979.1 MAG: 30S ribosomal protein S4 [Alphaproteobacteria bacterium MarineAlpha5_Bin7]PPR53995.1 MAG: 30S ribosomal protein S4 [Alphaproteobacteria bacterium MarineAlpha5_Bin6]|tara:strand:+ start:1019 stop:1639 length:621 start_codon:yes stop_codon:yes gene_type:complete
MTKRLKAKYKVDRRLGCNLWGRPKSPFNKRNSRPGQHGIQGQRKKLSDYGSQLFAKQKLRCYYGDLTEKQFRNIYNKASNIRGDTSQILIELLERRLDSIVYRMKFVPTIFAARQLVNHGHVKVNGKRVNIPSYTVKDGDEISLKDQSKEINIIQESVVSQEREIPEYLELDIKELKGRFLRAPLIHDVPYPVTMEPNLVIEYYSR